MDGGLAVPLAVPLAVGVAVPRPARMAWQPVRNFFVSRPGQPQSRRGSAPGAGRGHARGSRVY